MEFLAFEEVDEVAQNSEVEMAELGDPELATFDIPSYLRSFTYIAPG